MQCFFIHISLQIFIVQLIIKNSLQDLFTIDFMMNVHSFYEIGLMTLRSTHVGFNYFFPRKLFVSAYRSGVNFYILSCRVSRLTRNRCRRKEW